MPKKHLIKHNDADESTGSYDSLLVNDRLGLPYTPLKKGIGGSTRGENSVVYFEISSLGGRRLRDRTYSQPQVLGLLHIELRADIVPVAAANFLSLSAGTKGVGGDGVRYHYKGARLHRIVKDQLFQSGDLADSQ
ncbi:hypothetical protein B484DRAFT_390304, partial [Ochromonadaceae sp. CCMP2298]